MSLHRSIQRSLRLKSVAYETPGCAQTMEIRNHSSKTSVKETSAFKDFNAQCFDQDVVVTKASSHLIKMFPCGRKDSYEYQLINSHLLRLLNACE